MISPHDPCGGIYSILPEEWISILWFFEPVFIPQVFREHLVLVLGWTIGRLGYVSIAMVSTVSSRHPGRILTVQQITPDIPDGANPDYYMRIRAPRRRAAASEGTVTLRKNKTFSALVEHSYVRLDWVWQVPFAILLNVPQVGLQLMLRAVSMENIMSFYSRWGWDQAWGQTYWSRPEGPPWAGSSYDQSNMGPPEHIWRNGQAEDPQITQQPCRVLNGLVSSTTGQQDGETKDDAPVSGSAERLDSAPGPDDGEHGHLEETSCAQGEMVYAGDAHCAALAKLLREAR